jgi:hypothetical protein
MVTGKGKIMDGIAGPLVLLQPIWVKLLDLGRKSMLEDLLQIRLAVLLIVS